MRDQPRRKQNEGTLIHKPTKKMLTKVITFLVDKLLPDVAVLKIGDEIIIDGLGSTYEGTYYVEEVNHHFSSVGYRQRFKLTRTE